MMNNYTESKTAMIYSAKSMNEALQAYDTGCGRCLSHCEDCGHCPSTRAIKNVSHRREFRNEMANPDIRERLRLALDLGD